MRRCPAPTAGATASEAAAAAEPLGPAPAEHVSARRAPKDTLSAAAASSLDRDRQRAFALLQPICSVLLLQRGAAQQMAELLAGGWVAGWWEGGCRRLAAGQRGGWVQVGLGELQRMAELLRPW